MSEKISVIIPVYNVENYLEECILSVLGQTYTNLEVILVNDGSTDSSFEICKQYEKLDERVVVLTKENGGLSSARNFGLKHATGIYVGFIDSDDFIKKDMFQKMYEVAKIKNAEIVCCDFSECDEASNIRHVQDSNIIYEYNNYQAISKLLYESYYKCFAWNKLYIKELFDDICYPDGKLYEDIVTTYKLMKKSSKIAYIKTPFYIYRQRNNSITNSKFNMRSYEMLEAIDELIDDINNIPTKYQNDLKIGFAIYYSFFISEMINAHYMDKIIYKKYKGMLKENFSAIIFSSELNVRRKIQMILSGRAIKVYKLAYAIIKKRR